MHGRLKIRTSAEEAERKKKEQALKVKAYRAGMGKIFKKRQSNEFDEELLNLTGQVLSKNPDIYTLWNIRKECFLELKENLNEEEQQTLFDKDLHFTEQCLMVNPKSYGAWHHRCWILENCPTPNWNREVILCTKYLKLDERNFHCWDYRRFVVSKAEIPPEKEFEFCTEKIKNNFSNYSSWHYRSKLLPVLYPHETNPSRPINEEKLKEELEMVLTAAFTDPNDSSAWFYQRWLLGYSQPALDIAAFRITKNLAVISFTKAIDINDFTLSSNLEIDLTSNLWTSSNQENKTDTTWILKTEFNLPSKEEVYLIICEDKNGQKFQLDLQKYENSFYGNKCPKFEYEFGTAVLDELKSQLESCNQLLEFEPDSKWTLLTAALLMRAVDRSLYHSKSLEYLKKLESIDNLRKGYYADLASKWNIEKALENWIQLKSPSKNLILSDLQLTSIFYEQFMSIADEIDLSKNFLTNRSLTKFNSFQFCKKLNLCGNKFTSQEAFSLNLKNVLFDGNEFPEDPVENLETSFKKTL